MSTLVGKKKKRLHLKLCPFLPSLPCAVVSTQHTASHTETCCSDWMRPESPVRWCGLHSLAGPSGSPEDTQHTAWHSVEGGNDTTTQHCGLRENSQFKLTQREFIHINQKDLFFPEYYNSHDVAAKSLIMNTSINLTTMNADTIITIVSGLCSQILTVNCNELKPMTAWR